MLIRSVPTSLVVWLFLAINVAVAQDLSRYPLLVVEQNRTSVIKAIVDKWTPLLPTLAGAQQRTPDELGNALWKLRADRLLAASLAGSYITIQDVLASSDADAEAARGNAKPASKALGDVADDLVYTPLTPCRIVDTRNALGPLSANAPRTYNGYSATTFVAQGGASSTCGIPDNAAALAETITAVQPTQAGFLEFYPAGTPAPNASTLNFAAGQFATTTGAIVAVNSAGNNQFSVISPAPVDVVVDAVGYFKSPAGGAGPSNTIWVAKSGAKFTSVQAAIDSVSASATATSPYVIKIAPGVYIEQITLRDHIDVEGSGQGVTTIASGSQGNTVTAGANAEVRQLSIMSTGSPTIAAGTVSQSGGDSRFSDVTVLANGESTLSIGISVIGGTTTLRRCTISVTNAGQSGSSYGIYVSGATATIDTSTVTASLGVLANIGIAQSSGPSSPSSIRVSDTTVSVDAPAGAQGRGLVAGGGSSSLGYISHSFFTVTGASTDAIGILANLGSRIEVRNSAVTGGTKSVDGLPLVAYSELNGPRKSARSDV